MNMKKLSIFLAFVSAFSLMACSDSNTDYLAPRHFDDDTAPTVVSVSPADGSDELDVFDNLEITYDEPVFVTPETSIRIYTDDTHYEYVDAKYLKDDELKVHAEGNKLIIPLKLVAGQSYKVEVMKPTVRDEAYNFAKDYTVTFSTRAVNTWDASQFSITPNLVNANATEETQKLYQYLVENFGKKVITGAMTDVAWGNTKYADEMHEITGKYPALNCFDFMHHNWSKPLGNANWIDYTDTQVVEDWANNNGIVECMWHWNVPASQDKVNDLNSYTATAGKTTFTAKNATREGTWEHERAMRDIDVIADYILALQAKGIPVIWRPLHEARGNYGKVFDGVKGNAWFWWGTSGPAQFKKLWKMMFDEFKRKGVNNVIWVWTSEGSYTYINDKGAEVVANDADWYPGDEYVDIIARDYYCKTFSTPYQSSLVKEYNELRKITNGKKVITLAECDAIPSVENMFKDGAMWSWVMPWYGQDGDGMSYINSDYNTESFMKKFFNNKNVITRDQVPSFK